MLNINKLTDLREILNLKQLCKLAGVNYYTVKNKTLANRKNPERGELTPIQTKKISNALEQKGLKLNEKPNFS